jgi:hypothetical protein
MEWLLDAADDDGRWHDHQVTYTVLPRSLYYAHPSYSVTVLPAALSAFLNASSQSSVGTLKAIPQSKRVRVGA